MAKETQEICRLDDYLLNINRIFRFRIDNEHFQYLVGDYEFRILPGDPFRLELQCPDGRFLTWPGVVGSPGLFLCNTIHSFVNTARFFGLGQDEKPWQGALGPHAVREGRVIPLGIF